MTLVEFLLARVSEDEAAAREALLPDYVSGQKRSYYSTFGTGQDDWGVYYFNVPVQRVIAECEAHQRIVRSHAGAHECPVGETSGGYWDDEYPCEVVRLLALPYADHPDYQQEWAL